MRQIQTSHGQDARETITKELTDLNIASNYLQIPTEYKDVNEWCCNVQNETFCDLLEQSIYNKYADKTNARYMQDTFLNELQNNCRYKARATQFKELDQNLNGGLKSGLYVFGAVSRLGKTTFVQQLADNVASQGHKVIIFSLEQSRFELVCKSLSRITREIKPRRCKKNYRNNEQRKHRRGNTKST